MENKPADVSVFVLETLDGVEIYLVCAYKIDM